MIGNGFCGHQNVDDEVVTQFCSLGPSLPGWRMEVLDAFVDTAREKYITGVQSRNPREPPYRKSITIIILFFKPFWIYSTSTTTPILQSFNPSFDSFLPFISLFRKGPNLIHPSDPAKGYASRRCRTAWRRGESDQSWQYNISPR